MSENKDIRKLKVCTHDDRLTKKEEEVKKLLLKGFTPKQIANKLILAVCTIQTHCNNIYSKFHVNGQINLMAGEIVRLNKIIEEQEREICTLKKSSLNAA